MSFAPRIYADFNAIEYHQQGSETAEIPLTGYGTLASLSRQGVQLTEGMKLTLYEPGDIECDGVAHFDRMRVDPAGRPGEWLARINHAMIRDNLIEKDEPRTHPCSSCRADLNKIFMDQCRSYAEYCPICGTSVMAPMDPPGSAV